MYEKPLNLYHLFLKSGEIKARGLRPWAFQHFQAENPISFCTGVTSYFSGACRDTKEGMHGQVIDRNAIENL